MMLFSAVSGIIGAASAVALITTHLGFPVYFLGFISWAKLAGVVGLLVPGYPRVKEWIYAGFSFDILCAIYCFVAVGDPVSQWAPLLVVVVLIVLSYVFYHRVKGVQPVVPVQPA